MNMDELLDRAKDACRNGGNPSVDILAICRMMHAHHNAVRKALEAKIAGQRRVIVEVTNKLADAAGGLAKVVAHETL